MKPTVYKLITWLVCPVVVIVLVCQIVLGIMRPVKFEQSKAKREVVAIQRLKDIRTIQTAFKSETGHYASTIDSLKQFYESGEITVDMQIGSADDSVAVANTKALKKKKPKITNAEMLQMTHEGARLVFSIKSKVAVKDTLFNNRPGFCIDSVFMIPFCGQSVQMNTVVKQVSGVQVPLFEACMPYKLLLQGLDNQLRINLDFERKDTGRYPGLMVGSVTAPNNNAGNWE